MDANTLVGKAMGERCVYCSSGLLQAVGGLGGLREFLGSPGKVALSMFLAGLGAALVHPLA